MFQPSMPDGYMLVPKPEKKKFKITAVIPTVQYGNIQPEYEVEAESYEEAEAIAMPYIERLWNKYCQRGSELKPKEAAPQQAEVKVVEMVSTLTPGKALFNETAHTYTTLDGKPLLSGSKFAHQFQHPFDREGNLARMEEKFGIASEDIAELWQMKADVSTGFGTALHGALEMYGKFKDIGEKLGANKKPAVNTALHDHPILQKIVEEFYKGREKEVALYEEFVMDEAEGLCGQLDRVLIVDKDKKICRVQDFKTNANVEKKGFNGKLLRPFDDLKDTPLSGYWIQLSFYAYILQKHGWKVEALDVFAYNDKWTTYTREPIDLKAKGVLGS